MGLETFGGKQNVFKKQVFYKKLEFKNVHCVLVPFFFNKA